MLHILVEHLADVVTAEGLSLVTETIVLLLGVQGCWHVALDIKTRCVGHLVIITFQLLHVRLQNTLVLNSLCEL